MTSERRDLGGVVEVKGPDGPRKHWGRVHIAPADGVCSVDPLGCGYCLGVPCRQPVGDQVSDPPGSGPTPSNLT